LRQFAEDEAASAEMVNDSNNTSSTPASNPATMRGSQCRDGADNTEVNLIKEKLQKETLGNID